MASSFEKSVKGATKIKAAPPKSKYIEHILIATHSGEAGVAEVFRALQNRLRDSTWTVVLKSLITAHLMIREGSPNVTLAYLSRHRNILATSSFSDGNLMEAVLTNHDKVQTQGRNIRHYASYLTERARAYKETKCDFVRGAEKRFEKMTVDKGLLRETEIVQHQITALLKCDVLDNEPENEITITVFRMLVLDLLAMFHVMNQAMINILGHFFEMSRPDAERAMEIYKNFTRQTDFVVAYLSTARQVEHQTRVEVPKLKHAPVNLGKQLEDYLMDNDFEINRRQYLAEQESKGRGGTSMAFPSSSKSESEAKAAAGRSFPDAGSRPDEKPAAPVKGPDPDLIDFFESIEQNQQPMSIHPGVQQGGPQFGNGVPFQMQQPQFPQNGFSQQQTGLQAQNQFQQQPFHAGFGGQQQMQQPQTMQPNFTGAGFGGYTPQPSFQPGNLSSIPQDSAASFPQQQGQLQQFPQMQQQQNLVAMQTGNQQSTNPFRVSMMPSPTGASGPEFPQSPPITSPGVARQSTNPFAKSALPQPSQPLSPPTDQQFQQHQFQQNQQQQPAPMRPMATGTNPFARNLAMNATQSPSPAVGLMPQPTGSTNPFRQSQFVNTATGQGWQNNQQLMGGGLDSLESVPVFPRPAQQQAWQQ